MNSSLKIRLAKIAARLTPREPVVFNVYVAGVDCHGNAEPPPKPGDTVIVVDVEGSPESGTYRVGKDGKRIKILD